MSDSFFQKKRKRPPSSSSRGGADGSSSSSSRGKAGPSRLQMREGANASAASRRGKASRVNDKQATRSRVGKGGGGDEDEDDDDGGIEGMDLAHRYEEDILSSDEDKQETPAEARVRLARMYLDSLRDDDVDPNDADAAEADRQNIASRLQADAATHSTHVHTFVADRIQRPTVASSTEHILACRGPHRSALTAIVVGADRASFWTASKDGRIIRWRLRDGRMLEVISKSQSSDQMGDYNNGATTAPSKGVSKGSKSKTSGAARRRLRARGRLEGSKSSQGATGSEKSGSLEQIAPSPGQGHSNEVWALAVSSDGRHLASGGRDRRICVWRIESLGQSKAKANGVPASDDKTRGTQFVKALGGHKDSITALRFRQGSHDLFSASADRTLKLFDVSQLSYVETFFGHQEEVSGLDLLRGEVAVTAGSRDRTLRWWKIRDESQLVFRGGAKSKVRDVLEGGDIADEDENDGGSKTRPDETTSESFVEGSIDAVAMIDEHTFLSGGDSGTISLWSLAKKKPIFTVPVAHGFHDAHTGEQGLRQPRWITSLACLPYGDVFASGSWDGHIKLWKLNSNLRSFVHLLDIPATGFVNALEIVLPSRVAIRRLGGEAVQPSAWRRRGGLRGGPKKVFAIGENDTSSVDDDSEDDETLSDDAEEDSENTVHSHEEENKSTLNGFGTSSGQLGTGKAPLAQEQLIIVAAMGQEPVRGRWMRQRDARNGALVVPLSLRASV